MRAETMNIYRPATSNMVALVDMRNIKLMNDWFGVRILILFSVLVLLLVPSRLDWLCVRIELIVFIFPTLPGPPVSNQLLSARSVGTF